MLKGPLNILRLVCLLAIPSVSAYAQVAGQCGSANGTAPDSVLTATNDTLCDSGAVTGFSGSDSGSWSWSCQGRGGGATASCSAPANTANTCLRFTMPSRGALYDTSGRQVFALYFGDYFGLSPDNNPASLDFYTTDWLKTSDPTWASVGGFLRARPLPAPQGPNSLYRMMNFARDVRMALARGITGFVYEVSRATCTQYGPGCIQTLNEMLAAAHSVEPNFKIVLMPDASLVQASSVSSGPSTFMSIVTAVYNNPSIYKYNGAMVVAPWWDTGTAVPVSTWTTIEQTLASSNPPMPIFFMPIDTSGANWSAQQAASNGWGYFATAVPQEDAANNNFGSALWNITPRVPYMAGLTPQHYRPSTYQYWEPMDSTGLGFINGWKNLIAATSNPPQPWVPPPWVLITTWNDFSENTFIAPYTDADLSGSIGTGFYNLNGYFASWYLTGSQPTITHDMLYYFYKKEPVGAIPTAKCAYGSGTCNVYGPAAIQVEAGAPPGVDLIEVVAFVTQPGTVPGTVSVTVNGQTTIFNLTQGVQAQSMQVFSVPLPSGMISTTPTFTLSRNGLPPFTVTGQTPINSNLSNGYTDLTYWSGGGSANGMCNLSVPPESLTSTVVNYNGTCGPATGTSVASAPTSGLCSSTATASSVIGTGPFIWSCSNSSSQTTDVCSANLTSP
jgi:hypothetical protein